MSFHIYTKMSTQEVKTITGLHFVNYSSDGESCRNKRHNKLGHFNASMWIIVSLFFSLLSTTTHMKHYPAHRGFNISSILTTLLKICCSLRTWFRQDGVNKPQKKRNVSSCNCCVDLYLTICLSIWCKSRGASISPCVGIPFLFVQANGNYYTFLLI